MERLRGAVMWRKEIKPKPRLATGKLKDLEDHFRNLNPKTCSARMSQILQASNRLYLLLAFYHATSVTLFCLNAVLAL
jgi:hypothetical protein